MNKFQFEGAMSNHNNINISRNIFRFQQGGQIGNITKQIAQLLVQKVGDAQQALQIAAAFVQKAGGEELAVQILTQAQQQGQDPVELIAQALQSDQTQAYRKGGIFVCPEGYNLKFAAGGVCPICQKGDNIIKKEKKSPKYFTCGGRVKKKK